MNIEDYRHYYNLYFKEFNRLAVGEFADLSYGNDKPNDTASSLESIVAYLNFIYSLEGAYPTSILNAGVGASSWLFRYLHYHDITCADPHDRYIDLVRKICIEYGLSGERFQKNMLLEKRVGHVYYDYGSIERLPYLGSAIDNAEYSIYVDDTDDRDCCKPYREHVIALCDSLGLKWRDCKEAKDEYGRWGLILTKGE